jgi:signal transduction histidine kinase
VSVADDLRAAFLTSSLTDEQLGELLEAGEERLFDAGAAVFVEGRPAEALWVLLDGAVELSRHIGGQRVVVATMRDRGQWAGGLMAWGGADDHATYRATGTALAATRAFRVPSTELGRLVERWSPFSKHMISGVYQTVRSIDATARERESLVALGTLAAGLAHEINNPASASLRAVESLQRTSGYMISALIGLAEQRLDASQFLEIERLRLELAQREVGELSALARADREEAVGEWMDRRGVELAWQMAPVLAAAGVDAEWLARLEAATGATALDPALRWVSSLTGCTALLGELAEATSRIAHLVEDVKNYSQLDRAALQSIDITTGIDSTLAILASKLGRIEVVRRYDPAVPQLEAFAGELNQVWTNLFDNAIDAMQGEGTLTVTTSVAGDRVVVHITDTGPGIPADVLQHVFEPFFTTKDVGKGTGLGLDITRRIVVDRHGGDISFESSPGATAVVVSLPIHR